MIFETTSHHRNDEYEEEEGIKVAIPYNVVRNKITLISIVIFFYSHVLRFVIYLILLEYLHLREKTKQIFFIVIKFKNIKKFKKFKKKKVC